MDKIKPYLVQLKKYHFWVLCVVLLGAAYYGWSSGTVALQEAFDANRQSIRNRFQAAEGVLAVNPHPNEKWNVGIQAAHDRLREETLAAWQFQYDQQQDALQWPAKELGDRFVQRITDLDPTADIPDDMRDYYMSAVFQVIRSWRNRFHLRHVAPVTQEGVEPEILGIVAWPEYDGLTAQYTWSRRPTSTQIRIAQENFWIYEALLNIITEANRLPDGEMPSHRQAAIRSISTLNFGQAAARQIEATIVAPVGAAGAGQQRGPNKSAAKPGALPSVVNARTDDELLDGRYLDMSRNSVSATGVAALTRQEYRLVPVQLKVLMDQRKVPELLAACANSPLLVEPEQIRIVARDIETSASSTPSGSQQQGSSSQRGGAVNVYTGPNDAEVEIVGVMYMFNPPAETLQSPTEGDGMGEVPVANLD